MIPGDAHECNADEEQIVTWAAVAAWFSTLNGLEWTAALISALSVWLSTRQNVWSWPTAIVSVSLYFVVFRQARLYADMWLQAIYFSASIYGWWAWLYGGRQHTALVVSRTPWTWLATLLAAGTLGSASLGYYFATHTDAALPYLDSSLSAFSLVAQWQMTRKWIENWMLWIVLDVIYVGMFALKGLYPTAILYGVFLLLCVLGLRDWGRDLRQVEAAGA